MPAPKLPKVHIRIARLAKEMPVLNSVRGEERRQKKRGERAAKGVDVRGGNRAPLIYVWRRRRTPEAF